MRPLVLDCGCGIQETGGEWAAGDARFPRPDASPSPVTRPPLRYLTATTSISTRTPRGSPATATVERAG
ncbi:MAG: hypothetical protein ACHQXA_04510, partial [Gemmatimonadales bacterium]